MNQFQAISTGDPDVWQYHHQGVTLSLYNLREALVIIQTIEAMMSFQGEEHQICNMSDV
jgi:hypothetical protein